LAFIEWLDKNNMTFQCHRGRLKYEIDGIKKGYYPDFWVDEWNCFADVKADYFYNKEKQYAIEKYNPDVEIRVLFKKDLLYLGVKI